MTGYQGSRFALQERSHYRVSPVLRESECLIEYRNSDARGMITLKPGEFIIGCDGQRYEYGTRDNPKERKFNGSGSGGRYVVREVSWAMSMGSNQTTTTEVEVVSDQVLNFERKTLVKSLRERKAELEKKDLEAEQNAQDGVEQIRDQLVALLEAHPEFVKEFKRVINGNGSFRGEVGTEEFANSVADYDKRNGVAPHPDLAVIDRLIRMYDKAVDETVELSVGDQVVKFL